MRRGLIFLATLLSALSLARGETIIDDWAKVKPPPAPELKPVTVDPKTDALLVLDFNGHEAADSGPCNKTTKPRCIASLPAVRAAIDNARAKAVFVVYSLSSAGTPADIWPEIAPAAGEPVVKSGPNKFINTDLRELLDAKRIKRVIVTGTSAEGAVLNTGSDAAFHGMSVVIPVDGVSSTELYAEQYVAWHMTHSPAVAAKTTLTSFELMKF